MEKYPSNIWFSGDDIIFENVDYETVKVESTVQVSDVPYDNTYWNGRSNGDGKVDSKDQKIYKIFLGII